MNYTIIILSFVIIVMLYVGYLYYINASLVSGVVSLKNSSGGNMPIPWKKLDSPDTSKFHYEGWFFINQTATVPTVADGTALRYLFSRDNGTAIDLALVLYGTTLVAYKGDVNGINSVNGILTHKGDGRGATHTQKLIHITDSYPIQKWVYIVINVNDKIVEAYLNGKLVKTHEMSSAVEERRKSNLTLGNDIDGYVTRFKRVPKPLTPDDVWKNYTAGNGMSMFTNLLNGYNASFSVYSTAEDVRKFTMF